MSQPGVPTTTSQDIGSQLPASQLDLVGGSAEIEVTLSGHEIDQCMGGTKTPSAAVDEVGSDTDLDRMADMDEIQAESTDTTSNSLESGESFEDEGYGSQPKEVAVLSNEEENEKDVDKTVVPDVPRTVLPATGPRRSVRLSKKREKLSPSRSQSPSIQAIPTSSPTSARPISGKGGRKSKASSPRPQTKRSKAAQS